VIEAHFLSIFFFLHEEITVLVGWVDSNSESPSEEEEESDRGRR
jgi:hypothetical protein